MSMFRKPGSRANRPSGKNNKIVIETPRGRIVSGGNRVKARLEWRTDFQPKWQGRYNNSQKFVDSEVLRLCEKYIPLLTSALIKSGILGTIIGSGLVQWIVPYARFQYYLPRKPGTATGPLRGPLWFERMKSVSVSSILSGAKKIAAQGK